MPLLSRVGGLGDAFAALCSASEQVGDFVRVSGPGAVATVDIDAGTVERAVGRIVRKPSATSCVVQRRGEVAGSWVAGANYYVGPSGQAVTPRPTAPLTGARTIQHVGVARSAGILLLDLGSLPRRIKP